jgi:predicted RNase H-like HicB family nuclease
MTSVDEVLSRPYRRLLTPNGEGGFVASIHEFPGCIGEGETADEAIDQLDSAARGWVGAALATGYPVPEPANYDDFSGKIALRLSRRLHKMASERAALEGTSVNQLLSNAIAHYLGQTDGLGFATRQLRSAFITLSTSLQTSIHRGPIPKQSLASIGQSLIFSNYSKQPLVIAAEDMKVLTND